MKNPLDWGLDRRVAKEVAEIKAAQAAQYEGLQHRHDKWFDLAHAAATGGRRYTRSEVAAMTAREMIVAAYGGDLSTIGPCPVEDSPAYVARWLAFQLNPAQNETPPSRS